MTERRRLAEEDVNEDASVFIPWSWLQVSEGYARKATRSFGRSVSGVSPGSSPRSLGSPQNDTFDGETAEICGTEPEESDFVLCLSFRHFEGLSEAFGLSGDYVRSDQLYGDRPARSWSQGSSEDHVLPGILDDEKSQEKQLFLFYDDDDQSRRWKVAPEVGAKGLSVLARSPVGWDEVLWSADVLHKDLGPWQVRTLEPEINVFQSKHEMDEDAHFEDCDALEVVSLEDRCEVWRLQYPSDFCTPRLCQAVAEHPLAGDFRLLRQRYGKRPVYRRAPLQPCGPRLDRDSERCMELDSSLTRPSLPSQPGLFLFFEPRSGYWVVSTISPLAANHAVASAGPDVLGRFGQVLARSGPSWTPLLPQDAMDWEAADSQVPGFHHRLAPSRAPPSALLSEQLVATKWLRLMALGFDAPPFFLCIGGCGSRVQSLNGSYELLPESMWASRPAWKKMWRTKRIMALNTVLVFKLML
eukprot:g33486.t1